MQFDFTGTMARCPDCQHPFFITNGVPAQEVTLWGDERGRVWITMHAADCDLRGKPLPADDGWSKVGKT